MIRDIVREELKKRGHLTRFSAEKQKRGWVLVKLFELLHLSTMDKLNLRNAIHKRAKASGYKYAQVVFN